MPTNESRINLRLDTVHTDKLAQLETLFSDQAQRAGAAKPSRNQIIQNAIDNYWNEKFMMPNTDAISDDVTTEIRKELAKFVDIQAQHLTEFHKNILFIKILMSILFNSFEDFRKADATTFKELTDMNTPFMRYVESLTSLANVQLQQEEQLEEERDEMFDDYISSSDDDDEF